MKPSLGYLFPMARLGAPLNVPANHIDTTWFLSDSMSWAHGRHTFKFGVDYRHLNNHIFNDVYARGFTYSSSIGEFTSDSESFNPSQTFLRPSFDFAQFEPTPYIGTFTSYAIAGYVQDSWRIHPRFTINLGLRYKYFSIPDEEHNRIWNYDTS